MIRIPRVSESLLLLVFGLACQRDAVAPRSDAPLATKGSQGTVASVTVTPATTTIVVGASVQMTATVTGTNGHVLTGVVVTWATSNSGVAVVSATGLVTAVGPGSATITATSGGASGTSAITTIANVAFAAVSAGTHYSCGVATNSAGFCWGGNYYGQLGNGSTASVLGPSAVSGGLTFAALSIQYWGGCGLTTGGSTFCWGAVGEPTASGGALGGGHTDTTVPVAAAIGYTFTRVSEADAQACGLTSGAAYCWGWNRYGQLGNGTTTDSPTPVAVSGGHAFTAVSAGGDDHTCGLTTTGVTYCWGLNNRGQLGAPATDTCTLPLSGNPVPCSLSPVAVSGGITFTAVSAGGGHTCGLTASGTAYCWGANSSGQLGNGTTTDGPTPVAVSGGLAFAAISAGGRHTCGLMTGGFAYCWGDNSRGELGNGTTTGSATPVAVSGGLGFAAISAGGDHTCGLTTGGVAYCWGWNRDGQLGDGTQSNRLAPVKVVGQP